MTRRDFLLAAGAAVTSPLTSVPWTQWGGPHRNFTTEAGALKPAWAAAGPPVIWKRPLGEGYSSPSVEGNMLFTMYGRLNQEIVTAIEAGTGKTLWEASASVNVRNDIRRWATAHTPRRC